MRALTIFAAFGLAVTAHAGAPRTQPADAYKIFKAARAQCSRGGTVLDAIVSRYWNPAWARSLARYAAGSAAQRAEFDQLADQALGTYERRRAQQLICADRVTGRQKLEVDDGAPPRFRVTTQNDRCVKAHAPDLPCFCTHRLDFELRDNAWYFVGEGGICDADDSAQSYRTLLGLPSGQPVDIDVALTALRQAAAKQ